MKKAIITIILSGFISILPACGGSSSTGSDTSSDSSSGSTTEAYLGTWHIITQTLLAGGGSPSALVMDLSDKNAQLMIRGDSWVAMDNDPSSGCESTTLSVAYAVDQTWTSVITAVDGVCAWGPIGKTYTGSWSVDDGGNLTWTMDGLVSWYSEPM